MSSTMKACMGPGFQLTVGCVKGPHRLTAGRRCCTS